MKNQFVPYELALKLIKIGFNMSCLGYYMKGWEHHVSIGDPIMADIVTNGKVIAAPLWQQAFDWFREKHNYSVSINFNGNGFYYWWITKTYPLWEEYVSMDEISYDQGSYEVAREGCLKQLIKFLSYYESI